MKNSFVTKLRDGGTVFILTVPARIVEYEDLKIGDYLEVSFKKVDSPLDRGDK